MKQSVSWITESNGGLFCNQQSPSTPIEADSTDWRVARRREFDEQAMPHIEECYHAATYLFECDAEAEDLVEESFVRAYHAWQPFPSQSHCRLWLYRIMASAFVNKIDSAGRQQETMNDQDRHEFPEPSWLSKWQSVEETDQLLPSDISRDDFAGAIRRLPGDLRLILVLSLVGGFSYSEIAGITGTPLDLVGHRLHEGRHHVNESLRRCSLQKQPWAESSWRQEKMNG